MTIESCPAAFFSNLVSSSVRSVLHQKRDMAPALLPSVSSVLIKVYVEQEAEQRGFLLGTPGQHLNLNWFRYWLLLKTSQFVWITLANALHTQSIRKQDAHGHISPGRSNTWKSYPLVLTVISSWSVVHPACFEPFVWAIDLINWFDCRKFSNHNTNWLMAPQEVHSLAGDWENISPFYTFKSLLKQLGHL